MSAESDLLFPQLVDSLGLSDLSNFSEYEDFSKDILTMDDDGDGIALLEDLDCKSGLKPLLSIPELNDFGPSLEGIKEEEDDEEADMHHVAIKAPERVHAASEEARGFPQGKLESAGYGCTDGGTTVESIMNEAGVSPRDMVSTEEMSCMPLEEDLLQSSSSRNSWRALTPTFEQVMPIPSNSVPSLAQGNQIVPCTEASPSEACGICGTAMEPSENSPASVPTIGQRTANGSSLKMMNGLMHVDTMPSVVPSIFHINSPLSSSPSSSVSTPDGSSVFKTFGQQEEGVHKHQMNVSMMQQAASVDLDTRTHQADHSLLVGPRHHVSPNISSSSAMPRSRSSHALGHFRMPSQHLAPCPEELRGVSMQKPSMGYSNVCNFPHYQPSSSPSLAETSSAIPMRRVYSTGDIQARDGESNMTGLEHVNRGEHIIGLKVGHYTVEERRVRLDRYRQKRNERNFSKKIKYACRKTLADSRPRIRGRFARTLDDFGEPLLRENGSSYEDDYDEVPFKSNQSGAREGGMQARRFQQSCLLGKEVDALRGHCSVPNNGSISLWNATQMNGQFQHGH